MLLGVAALVVVAAGVAVGQGQDPLPAEPLVIGAALPITGPLAPFGTAQQRGIERALDDVNSAGGIELAGQRRQVQLLLRDTRSLPDVAGQEALVLVRGPFRLVGLVGPCTPPVAMVRVAESRQVPLVTGCQPLPALGGALDHTFEVAPTERQRARTAFAGLRTSPGRRTGLFLSNDRLEGPWTAAAAEAGFDVVGTYRPQGRDWGPAVARAAVDRVEVVVAVTQPPDGIDLWRALRRQGIEPQSAYASEAGLGSAWYAAVGRDGEGTLTDLLHPSVRAPATPLQVDAAVTTVSTEVTRLLLDGLRRAAAAERSDLRAALTGASGDVAGEEVRLGDRTSRLPARLGRWQDGRLVPVPP